MSGRWFVSLCLLAVVVLTGLAGGCAHRQPKASFRIIDEGDPNPMIRMAPARAGEVRVDSPRH
jgi:hypothetical protein